MSRLIVLMYHALYADSDGIETIDAEDRPYAVRFDEFVRQLDVLATVAEVLSPEKLGDCEAVTDRVRVVISFDDGHASNYRLAFPELQRRGWSAILFVTTDFVGRRPGFCTWENLREMVEGGMVVGSHGKTHRFLDELTDVELTGELTVSRDVIAAQIGRPVDSISFPGGRYDHRVLRACFETGLTKMFLSEVGGNRVSSGKADAAFKRVAVRSNTDSEALRTWFDHDGIALRRMELIDRAKRVVRRLLGNSLYHFLYKQVAT